MQNTYFISTSKIKEQTHIDQNVSDKTLSIMLRTAEFRYCQELLGKPLYTTLKSGITNNKLTSYQRILVEDYVIPYEICVLEVLSFYDLLLKVSEAGINSTTPTNTQQRTKDELLTLRKHFEGNSNFAAGLLKDYIIENLKEFPEYEYIAKGLVPRKFGNSGFFLDSDDFAIDDSYNRHSAENRFEESI